MSKENPGDKVFAFENSPPYYTLALYPQIRLIIYVLLIPFQPMHINGILGGVALRVSVQGVWS